MPKKVPDLNVNQWQSPAYFQFLRRREMSVTSVRLKLLYMISSEGDYLVPFSKIIHHPNFFIPKVSAYRALSFFVDHGVIYRLFDKEGNAHYGLHYCIDTDEMFSYPIHLYCNECRRFRRLDIKPPFVPNPIGDIVMDMECTLLGVCESCKHSKQEEKKATTANRA